MSAFLHVGSVGSGGAGIESHVVLKASGHIIISDAREPLNSGRVFHRDQAEELGRLLIRAASDEAMDRVAALVRGQEQAEQAE
jgi:hypothetical protein